MVNYNSVISQIEAPNFREKDLKKYQNTGDIIKDLIYCFKNYNYQCAPIAKKFSSGSVKSDSKKIYDFIKENIYYEAEPDFSQTTKSFSRILHDREGDCKHSALIVGCIGWNLGYNVIFRFVSYHEGESYGHVYTVLQDPQTKEKVIVDPLQPFNTEKKIIKKINYLALNNLKHKNMLSRLTGLDSTFPVLNGIDDLTTTRISDTIGGRGIVIDTEVDEEHLGELEELSGIGRRTKAQRQAARAARKEKRHGRQHARQAKRKEKRAARGGSVFKKIALAPARAAFDAVLAVNFRDIAGRLAKALDKNPTSVQKFAAKFGYKYDFLVKQINKGKNKKPLFGKKKLSGIYDLGEVGFVVSSAAIAAAAPIIVAAVSLLKSLGIGHKEGAPSDEEVIKDSADDIQKGGSSDSGSGGAGADTPEEKKKSAQLDVLIKQNKDVLESPQSTPAEKAEAQTNIDAAASKKEEIESSPAEGSGGGFLSSIPKPVLFIGGAALAFVAYKLITKKK